MSSRKPLFREVYGLIQKELCALGMKKYARGIYGRDVSEDVRGMVGLNAATKYGFSINPIIGIQYMPLELLLAELNDRPFHPTRSGDTLASPIGYLGPANTYKTWHFAEGADNAAIVADMAAEIATIGFRYMEEEITLEKICQRIAVDRHFIMGNDVYQLPVALMLLGRTDEAEAIVKRALLERKYYPAAYADYRPFAERVLQKVEETRRPQNK